MSAISALPGEIVQWLSRQTALEGITFLTEFPSIKKAVPLRSTIVAVGIDEMTITDSFTENEDGVLVENEYCRNAQIKIRLDIHAPFASGGEACHDAFTDILDCLTFASDLDIEQSGCESVAADRDTDAFVLRAFLSVKASFCPAVSSSLSFASFINKDLLCATHITDSSIHLSPAQQTRLDTPIATGTYFGTGESSRSVSLGFKPIMLVVFANGLPMSCNSSGTYTAFAGFATESGGTLGIELTPTGFKTSSGSTNALRNTTPQFNESGTFYSYLAFR